MFIIHIHRGPIPSDHTVEVIKQLTELDPNAPTICAASFLANLLLTVTFSNGKEQLNRITIKDCEKGWISHQ